MRYKIEFGFGVGEDRNGNLIRAVQRVGALGNIRRAACDLFRGYTLYKTVGGWINEDGRIVEEPGCTLTVYSETLGVFRVDEMVNIIKSELRQHSVAVIVTEVTFSFE
jgi:hypothetical protein